ncbi:hypothetical protein Fot_10492 [Forsythia ovata]|uniref:Uncharacterized protein n=1 Tax=Forsythia ovata TaxID=205694 RepID=A0ABD1WH86_9LAMI
MPVKNNGRFFPKAWFGQDVDQSIPDVESQNVTQKSQSRKSASTATPEPSPFEFQFMPNPGIMPANSTLYNKSGPTLDVHGTCMGNALASDVINEVQTQSFSFDNMVDDLQQMEQEE